MSDEVCPRSSPPPAESAESEAGSASEPASRVAPSSRPPATPSWPPPTVTSPAAPDSSSGPPPSSRGSVDPLSPAVISPEEAARVPAPSSDPLALAVISPEQAKQQAHAAPPSSQPAPLAPDAGDAALAGPPGTQGTPAAAADWDLETRARMHSIPVPLISTRSAAQSRPPRRRGSSYPPSLVEPKRIIEVLGSSVPALGVIREDEDIEDLHDSEAEELSESLTLAPDAAPSDESSLDRAPSTAQVDPAPAPARAPLPPAKPATSRTPPSRRARPPSPPSTRSELPKPDAPARRGWWEEMFSEDFLRAIPILSPSQLSREVSFIENALRVVRGARLLDLACGAGQHAVDLAARGYDVIGYDLSRAQLDWAGELASERGQSLQLVHGDMRELSYQQRFDGVFCWNTSFGYFEEDKNVDIAQRVFKALRPGGHFLLDVVNRDFVVSQQPGQTWFEGDGCVCMDDVKIDFITSRLRVKRTLMLNSGKNAECNYSLRLYGLHELGKLLHDIGFKVLNVSGRPEMPGVFFGAASPRLIILASKPAK